ncbi:hypothetical protein [Microseira wollei]|uniref:NHLP leader peptide family natural product n=1 Tax=Microseira wollei NIES-4236 TaxID=2530354 RepID=A0AAV3X5P3_9CYAN|nr:hypothetical protein [Microseira wollei]GET35395.1 hypothetical protein MiSe_01370 [Microseira wollei NIES-4236]
MTTLLSENLQAELAEKAAKDTEFAARLIGTPKETLSSFINMDLPSDLKVSVHQESRNELHIVLPAIDAPQKPEMDIADDEILAGCTWGANCQSSIG